MKPMLIAVEWDEEAQVWFVKESDVPGLVVETGSLSGMMEKLKMRVPELVALNAHQLDPSRNHLRFQMVVDF